MYLKKYIYVIRRKFQNKVLEIIKIMRLGRRKKEERLYNNDMVSLDD